MTKQQARRERLLERLKAGPVIVGDGGMGTQLYHRGAPVDAVFEYLNLIDSALVSQVHADYLAGGAELVETNTFGANALRLSSFGLEAKTRSINLAGAELARAAAGPERWVAGSVGPLAQKGIDGADLDPFDKMQMFREQMSALADGGVDCLLLETFSRTDDLLLALQVANEIGLPAIAQLAFTEGGFSGDGLSVEAAAECLTAAGPVALGANCGAGPRELLGVLKRLASATDLPLTAFPNSGFPEYVNGRHIYLATPEYFAGLAREMTAVGVGLIGGCCGTTPEHIAALSATLEDCRPGPRPQFRTSSEPGAPVAAPQPRGDFLSEWGQRPVITVELDPPKGLDV